MGASPPGPVLQSVNRLLHKPPISFLFYGLFWSLILIVASPLAGCALLALTALRCVRYAALLPLGRAGGPRLEPNKSDAGGGGAEYAVVITGCDSGFGRSLAHEMSRRGFVVFAGCLAGDAARRIDDGDGGGRGRIVGLKMDVTRDDEVGRAFEVVSEWVKEGSEGRARYLHALVNNAGIGTGGWVDWMKLSDFRMDMEVNYFGMIRVVKAFLPLLKAQAYTGTHSSARIVNMVSMAGLVAQGSLPSYYGSKHAAEAFSTCLRHEMATFGIPVVTVNPSFHDTPLVRGVCGKLRKVWEEASPELRSEYGEEFFKLFCKDAEDTAKMAMWQADTVVDELASCVELHCPPPQVAVGSDAKYALLLLRHIPVWCQDWLVMEVVTKASSLRPILMAGRKGS